MTAFKATNHNFSLFATQRRVTLQDIVTNQFRKKICEIGTMGAAASTENHSSTVQQFRQTVLEGKPLDASDIKVCLDSEIAFKVTDN